MSRVLVAGDHRPRLLAPITTAQFAERMLAASYAIAHHDAILLKPVPTNILLRLFLAEDASTSVTLNALTLPGDVSQAVKERWMAMLVKRGWVERRGDLVDLTPKGYDVVAAMIEAIFQSQRALD